MDVMEECVEHVKKYGINRVMLDLSVVDKHGYNSLFTEYFTRKLKQIVDAFELIDRFGGVKEAKRLHYDEFRSDIDWNNLQKSINIFEKCNEIRTAINSK